MVKLDVIRAKGHPNIKASHRSTFEITKENFLTPRGDCIIGISADKGARDLDEGLKSLIRKDNSYVYIILYVGNLYQIVKAVGSSKLSISNDTKVIIRKSDYISDSTIAIKSNFAARDIDRRIVNILKNSNSELYAYILASDSALEDKEILRILIDFFPNTLA